VLSLRLWLDEKSGHGKFPSVQSRMVKSNISKLLVFVGFLLAVFAGIIIFGSHPREQGPVVAGQPVSYWIRTLPFEADRGFVDYTHPLEQAGPEIIPALIATLESSRAPQAFYQRALRLLPSFLAASFLAKALPPPNAPLHRTKTFAAFRLGQFGPAASNAVPALVNYCKDTNGFGFDRAIQALGNIGAASEPALPIIVGAFHNPRIGASWLATALLQIGKVPPEATPSLESLLSTTQGHIAGTAAVALWVAKPDPESLQRLHSFLLSTNRSIRAHAAASLRFTNRLSTETKEILVALLKDSEPSVAQGAAMAIARTGEDPRMLIPVLIDGLKTGEFRIQCAEALGEIGPSAGSALPTLKANADTNSPALCRAFLQATERISPAG
jgi:HEAT repeat protein